MPIWVIIWLVLLTLALLGSSRSTTSTSLTVPREMRIKHSVELSGSLETLLLRLESLLSLPATPESPRPERFEDWYPEWTTSSDPSTSQG